MSGFLIAGASSGIGKTTISMGLMNLLEDISPFKSGPDFIDPSFHKFVTGMSSYNLDLFLMGVDGVRYSFKKHSKNFSIVEGAMGLYDGINNTLDNFSAAHLSRILNLPVILVVDGIGKGTSIASQVLGYKNFDSRVNIAGVIINKVSSHKSYQLYREAIEMYTGIRCLGYLEKNSEFDIASRHLGLLQAEEVESLREKIELISHSMRKTIDLDYIRGLFVKKVARDGCLEFEKQCFDPFIDYENRYLGLKIGVARDKAFSFYYEDNLELLKRLGVKIIEFSPLEDQKIPDVDLLYFGGGYPENYLIQLSSNTSMIDSVRDFYLKDGVILGECGGFMYLSKEVENLVGERRELCGLTDCTIKMGNKLDISRFGYVNIKMNEKRGKAHEFHYSKIEDIGEMELKYEISKEDGKCWRCGYSKKNLIAGYPHLHFFGSLEILFELLERAKNRFK